MPMGDASPRPEPQDESPLGQLRRAFDEFWPRPHVHEIQQAREIGWRADHPNEYCRRCGATTGPSGSTAAGCSRCLGKRQAWDRIVRVGVYDTPLLHWILQLKYHHRWLWCSTLGPMLADAIRASDARYATADATQCSETFVTFVPMHLYRRWYRGFNQASLLAREVSDAMGWPMLPVLRRVRHTKQQVRLALSRRAANVKDAFAVEPVDLSGCRVWLVDDIKTTGATLRGCARLLRECGAAEVNVAVIAVAKTKREAAQRHRRLAAGS